MPIFEYSCADCGTRFEKLVRRAADENLVACPACGEKHLNAEYSTFAAHAGSAKSQPSEAGCGASYCGGGMCQGGMCGMDVN